MKKSRAWFFGYLVASGCFAACANSHEENGVAHTAPLGAVDSGPATGPSTIASASGPTRMCSPNEVAEKNGCVDYRQIVAAVKQYADPINACAHPGEPTGLGNIRMIFDPANRRADLDATRPAFRWNRGGSLRAPLVESIRIPPFQGSPYKFGPEFIITGAMNTRDGAPHVAPPCDGGSCTNVFTTGPWVTAPCDGSSCNGVRAVINPSSHPG